MRERETDAEREARVLAERARRLAPPPGRAAAAAMPVLAFDAGEDRYALTLGAVLRLERAGAVARIPGASPEIAGAIALEGRPCALLDLPALLRGAPAAARRWAIVLGRRGPEVAVAADRVDLAELPAGLPAPAAPPRLGVAADGRVVVDGAALLSTRGAR